MTRLLLTVQLLTFGAFGAWGAHRTLTWLHASPEKAPPSLWRVTVPA
ncbi:MAG: hypothetical protein ACOYBX_11940 [Mycobacterium sp.]